ncbi:hypothetical protein WDL1P2_00136 (plasmid) [Variovorax sp. WDL1]|nr:hypothetical protein CHC06_06540 [Variovorax sp. B2]PNG49306.1 hypothetical protein CHC07_06188 [Variovorax sp. B4]VTV18415.1 hypothetical protein WDL1P2_00136 [Variovorax sp. WDL1]
MPGGCVSAEAIRVAHRTGLPERRFGDPRRCCGASPPMQLFDTRHPAGEEAHHGLTRSSTPWAESYRAFALRFKSRWREECQAERGRGVEPNSRLSSKPADHLVADAQRSALKHPRRKPSMPSHQVVAARPEHLLHSRTWLTRSSDLQTDLVPNRHFERLIPKEGTCCRQVQARNHQVASQQGRVQLRQFRKGGHDRQMLGLDQSNLPAATSAAAGAVVSFEPLIDKGHDLAHRNCRSAPGGTEMNGIDAARPGEAAGQSAEVLHAKSRPRRGDAGRAPTAPPVPASQPH